MQVDPQRIRDLTAALVPIVKDVVESDQDISPNTSFIGDLDIDSLTMVRLDTIIQARLRLALSADDLDRIDTIEDLARALAERGQPVAEDE